MKNKGFAITTMVYASVMLLAIIIFTVLTVVRNEYDNQKDLVTDVNKTLTKCLETGDCKK